MKNRKKFLKNQAKRKITTHIVNNLNNMLFHKIKLHYVRATDDFICELFCIMQNKQLSIKGIIDPDMLANNNITIEAPYYMKSPIYNCTAIAVAKKDVPEFYELVKSYIYNIADRLDNNLPYHIDYKFESKFGVNDNQLKTERENFLNVYKIETK